jgi:hypothetical protein
MSRILMLGPSEAIGQSSDLFEVTDKPGHLYVRRATPLGLDAPRWPRAAIAVHATRW